MRVFSENPGKTLIAVSVALAIVHFAGLFARGERPRLVRGDAVHYYVYVRSAVFDRDLDFENDYKGLYRLDFTQTTPPPGFVWAFERTPTGRVRNYMAVGTPLWWSPLYLMASAGVYVWSLAGGTYPLDGYGIIFQLVPDISGMVAVGLALWFTFLMCQDLCGPRTALLAVLSMFAGSSLLYYGLVSPSYSHGVSAMAASGFLLYWWRTRNIDSLGRYAVVGALAGLVALVRWQDGILIATIVLDIIWQARRLHLAPVRAARFAGPRLMVAGVAALAAFAPQMIAWQALYGQPLTVPQGAGFMRWTDPQVVAVLISPLRGLFSWTPLAAVGLAGLGPLWKRHRRLVWALGLFFVANTYINASVADWWAGEAFGARRFMSGFPVFAVGLAALLALDGWRRAAASAVTAVLVASNLLLLLHYELFMLGYTSLVSYPDNWSSLWLERFVLPFRLLFQ